MLFSQPINRTFVENNGDTILLGRISPQRLAEPPFDIWFYQANQDYSPDHQLVDLISKEIHEVDSIAIFMGTWCGDSRREVPKFLKLTESFNFPTQKLSITCVDHSQSAYKQSPAREEYGWNIHRVPTFLFFDKDKKEINRIVESPIKSLEEDVLAILSGEYQNRYLAIDYIHGILTSKGGMYHAQNDRKKIVDHLSTTLSSPYELNTYARMLLTSDHFVEAEWVYELNTGIFPDYFVGRYWLARIKMQLGKYNEAIALLDQIEIPHEYAAIVTGLKSEIKEKSNL